ncbi:hypothetical protein OS493_003867 [Desmophyllum pertusum]|uniref:Uncharacterized protein n=1 Tax=Desmophyllum pertusum TaxID=174260 RepID=A0A9X0A691_9CNID|nr:hypothetical protein OS493_003867 [Desmophyllum pertusum]
MERQSVFEKFVLILIFVATVHGLTQCPAREPYKSYTCPGPLDPPERTRCCFWYGPTCCLSGGSSCSDKAAHIRNYCPGPNDGKNDKVCCTVNNVAKCCGVELVAGIVSGAVVFAVVVLLIVCCFNPKCPLAKYRKRRQMLNVAAAPPPGIPQWPSGYNGPPGLARSGPPDVM